MAALDDRQDVYDYCVRMGLDPDSNRNLAEARTAMYAEAEARWKARGGTPGTSTLNTGAIAKLMKERYGRYAKD